MKKPLAILVALLVACIAPASAQFPQRERLVGYVDRSGKVVEPPNYQHGSMMFRGDWVGVFRDGKAGYLNLRTRAATGLVFDQVADDYERALFAEGPEPARIGARWGFVDETGKFVVPPRFDGAKGFGKDGLAIVQLDDPAGLGRREGFIDKVGNVVVPARYDMLRPYSGGLAVFRLGVKWGALDRQGREAIPPRFGHLAPFAENGLAPASLDYRPGEDKARFGYVDRTGRFVIPENFTYAGSFTPVPADGGTDAPDGLARVVLAGGDGGYIDPLGKILTRFPAGLIVGGVSSGGLVRVQDMTSAKYGFADRTGKIVIPVRFEQAGGFAPNGLASARENGKAGYIRADGSWAIAPRFALAGTFDRFGQAQAEEEGGGNVLIDRTGAVVARLPKGANFYWQQSEYSAFKTHPPQIDFPPERFGRWVLERRLYAEPEYPDLGPTSRSSIRLTFRTADGTVRWGLRTEGWTLDAFTDEGPENQNDVSSQSPFTDVPAGADLIALLGRQLKGHAELRLEMTPGKTEAQAAQRERLRKANAARADHLAELEATAPHLERALEALRARIAEHYGKLSGPPCMPPKCLY